MAQGNDRTMLVAASGSDSDVQANTTGRSHRRRKIIGGTVGLGVALAVVLWRSYGRKDLATPTFKGDSLVSLAESSSQGACVHDVSDCVDKLGTFFTMDCEHENLGCYALGIQCCRSCGVGDYKTIPCPTLVAKAMAQAASEEEADEKLCGHGISLCMHSLNTFFTKDCLTPGVPGCSALGRQCCRFCGVGDYKTIHCPHSFTVSATQANVDKRAIDAIRASAAEELCGHSASLCLISHHTFFTKDCLKPGLGCSALGRQCCRFCGVGEYVECPPVH